MKTYLYSILCIPLFLCANVAQAGLIVNGGFEANDINNNSWKWFDSSKVSGWDGSNIEIWDSLQKFESFEGEQHAELNAHGSKGSFSIFQTFSTDLFQAYQVDFAYAARKRNSESFLFEILDETGSSLFSNVMDDHTIKTWSTFNHKFIATTALTTIRFTTINTGTYGNFLDNVNVSALVSPGVQVVSEPSNIALFTLTLLGLVSIRKKKLKTSL